MDAKATTALSRIQPITTERGEANQSPNRIVECELVRSYHKKGMTINLGRLSPHFRRALPPAYSTHRGMGSASRQPVRTVFDLWSTAETPS
ncbi:unnamed protein product [Echinostoma caproni]|uniref:Uncharacterized protein n=1 Tax=Echinostoma caproni TaxID=27848 RepID=A0A183BD60_9TREM|nr:unnamed protein product [Echinostoma caproni]